MPFRCLIYVVTVFSFAVSTAAPAVVCSTELANAFSEGTPLRLLLKEGTEVEVEFLGFNAAHMADPGFAARMKTQVEEIERFLNELGADYPDGKCPICTTAVRPGNAITWMGGRQLLWHGGNKLTVRVPHVPVAGLLVSDNDALRVKWNLGKHHSTKSLVSQRWAFLNPAGPVRLGLRHTLTRVLDRLHLDADNILNKTDRSKIREAVRGLVMSQLPSTEGILSPAATKALASIDTPEKAEQFLRELKEVEAAKVVQAIDSQVEEAANGESNSGEPSTSSAYSLFVSVANAHDIRIGVHVVNGRLQSQVSSPRQPLKVRAVGLLVAVATSDRVEIDLGMERAAGALAIEQALLRISTP